MQAVHSIKCVLLMVRLTLYVGFVHLGGAFEVSTTRIHVLGYKYMYPSTCTNFWVVVKLQLAVLLP